jgi:hypothetical protein
MNGLITPEPGRGAGGASQLVDIPIDPHRDATSSKCSGQASKSLLELVVMFRTALKAVLEDRHS